MTVISFSAGGGGGWGITCTKNKMGGGGGRGTTCTKNKMGCVYICNTKKNKTAGK